MARTTITEVAGKTTPTYGYMLDQDKVQTVIDMLNEHAAALDSVAPSGTTAQSESISAAGALAPGIRHTELTVSGTKAYTLADGTIAGFVKNIKCISATNTPAGTLTITTPESGTNATYLFDVAGQEIDLLWTGTAWRLSGLRRAGKKTYTVGTNNVSAAHLYYQLDLSISGTVASSMPDGVVSGDRVHFTVSTAGGTPHGSVTGHFAKLTGVASGTWGSGTDITSTAAYLIARWDAGVGAWVSEGNDGTVTFA